MKTVVFYLNAVNADTTTTLLMFKMHLLLVKSTAAPTKNGKTANTRRFMNSHIYLIKSFLLTKQCASNLFNGNPLT